MTNAIEVRNLVKTYESGALGLPSARRRRTSDVRVGELMLLMGSLGQRQKTTPRLHHGRQSCAPAPGSVQNSGQGKSPTSVGKKGPPACPASTTLASFFRASNLFPTLTAGRENVELAARTSKGVRGAKARQARENDLLEQVGLAKQKRVSYPSDLSGGQKQARSDSERAPGRRSRNHPRRRTHGSPSTPTAAGS